MKRHVELQIKDIKWKFNLLHEKEYEEIHGNDSDGITKKTEYEVDLIISSLSLKLIKHEMVHAYVASCCINSMSNITDSDMEELIAEIFENHAEEMLEKSNKVYEALKPIKVKMKNALKKFNSKQ